MISEIYAIGRGNVSAFLIVEGGEIVHYGSHKWSETIDFEGISAPSIDDNCEVIAIICALIMCQNNHRQLVNIYTENDDTHHRYDLLLLDSPFMDSFVRHSSGMDICAEKWQEQFYDKAGWKENRFKNRCLELLDKN